MKPQQLLSRASLKTTIISDAQLKATIYQKKEIPADLVEGPSVAGGHSRQGEIDMKRREFMILVGGAQRGCSLPALNG